MFEYDNTEIEVVKKDDFRKEHLPEDYEAVNQLGDCFTSLGRFDHAKDCYDKAAVLDPDKAAPYAGLGTIALQQGNLEEAVNAFKVARRLDGDCAKAYCGLGMVYQQYEEYPQAFDLYLKSLEIDTDNLTALLGLFQTSCLMGSFSKVIKYLEIYLKMYADDTSVMFCLATLYMKDRRLCQAKQTLQKLLQINPENNDSAILLEEVEYLIEQENSIKAN